METKRVLAFTSLLKTSMNLVELVKGHAFYGKYTAIAIDSPSPSQ